MNFQFIESWKSSSKMCWQQNISVKGGEEWMGVLSKQVVSVVGGRDAWCNAGRCGSSGLRQSHEHAVIALTCQSVMFVHTKRRNKVYGIIFYSTFMCWEGEFRSIASGNSEENLEDIVLKIGLIIGMSTNLKRGILFLFCCCPWEVFSSSPRN